MSPLRKILFLITLLVACVGPFLDGTADPYSWKILPTVITPTLMLILAFVLPLDMTMAMVFMTDTVGEQRRHLKSVLKLEAGLTAVLFIAWVPFFLRLFEVQVPGISD